LPVADLTAQFEWGYPIRRLETVSEISIHHSVTTNLGADATVAAELRQLEAIQAEHQDQRQWANIGYWAAIAQSGRVYLLSELDRLRASVANRNDLTIGVVLLGTFTTEPPAEPQIASAARVCAEYEFALGRALAIDGHRRWNATECPGATFEQWLPRIQAASVANRGGGQAEVSPPEADVIDLAIRIAGEEAVRPRDLLALTWAESEWQIAARRPKNPAMDAAMWPDVSSGLGQQTVAYSDEFRAMGLDARRYPGPEVTEQIMAAYRDPEHALRVAAGKLRYWLSQSNDDFLDAACRYNWPAMDPAKNPHRGRYAQGLAVTDRMLAGR
jgi:hypothetical protein